MLKDKLKSILNIVKPWVTVFALFLILRYTGMLSGISSFTSQALMSTGALDADVNSTRNDDFNYDFTIQDMEGKNLSLKKYEGKVIFLNIWATWCGPCRAEMAGIQQLYSKIDDKDIAFIMLSVDKNGQQQKVKDYITDRQFTFPVFMPSGSLPAQLQVPSIPTTFIIGKDGKILSKQVGSANFDTREFREYLEGLTRK